MKKNIIPILVIGVVVIALAILVIKPGSNTGTSSTALDEFGRCLASKGAVMYGAEWCPHCQNEKKALGSGLRFVDYVECPDNPKLCIDKGIEGYPTWVLEDGTRLVGEQGIERLAQATGCPVPTAE